MRPHICLAQLIQSLGEFTKITLKLGLLRIEMCCVHFGNVVILKIIIVSHVVEIIRYKDN